MSRSTPIHSIHVASRLTGIPIETLRVWERRYGFPRPSRSETGNRRLYSDAEIERLKWIARALERGFRAGEVVPRPVREIEALIGAAPAPEPSPPPAELATVASLVDALANDDIAFVENEVRRLAAALGPKRFVMEVAHPFAVAVGEAWGSGTIEVRQEHWASECLATQLRLLLAAYQDAAGDPVVVLATLPGEPHALGLAMVALYLAVSGAKPRLVGASTPPDQIVAAARALDADVVGLTITPASDPIATPEQVAWIARELPARSRLWLGGVGAQRVEPRAARKGATVRVVGDWEALDDALADARSR